MPNPTTGEPRPPTAHRGEARAHWVTMPGDLENSVVPLEYGPALEAFEEPRREKLLQAVMLICIFLLFFIVPFRGFGWADLWFPWLVILGLPVLQYRKSLGDRVLAGARWVQQRDEWISTYEITKIRSTTVGLNRASKIEDVHGNKLILVLPDAQMNPLLWNLVYNGIVHSVAYGNCDISKAARRILEI
ncbi:hypothetical protein MTX35_13615 [Rhodococcus sp. ARC_M12]|uniref:hypothetical protein n=1 Tax=Rhodococcus sp. ARC_M12 TaxID=2928854 RepID=UPI001FB371B5|nr:hypothetical protein [Rhodococcus sp. ARC_M12]MCJ0978750.1 hypothetical protein [Rhodococcus sp. ARC_M12]